VAVLVITTSGGGLELGHVRYLSCSGPRGHFVTYLFDTRVISMSLGTTTRLTSVPFWTTLVPEILHIW